MIFLFNVNCSGLQSWYFNTNVHPECIDETMTTAIVRDNVSFRFIGERNIEILTIICPVIVSLKEVVLLTRDRIYYSQLNLPEAGSVKSYSEVIIITSSVISFVIIAVLIFFGIYLYKKIRDRRRRPIISIRDESEDEFISDSWTS
jgi:large-conductance mechanosensitive channel